VYEVGGVVCPVDVDPVGTAVPEVLAPPATVPGVTRFEVVRDERPIGKTAATV
jgi:hypothetical protein